MHMFHLLATQQLNNPHSPPHVLTLIAYLLTTLTHPITALTHLTLTHLHSQATTMKLKNLFS